MFFLPAHRRKNDRAENWSKWKYCDTAAKYISKSTGFQEIERLFVSNVFMVDYLLTDDIYSMCLKDMGVDEY